MDAEKEPLETALKNAVVALNAFPSPAFIEEHLRPREEIKQAVRKWRELLQDAEYLLEEARQLCLLAGHRKDFANYVCSSTSVQLSKKARDRVIARTRKFVSARTAYQQRFIQWVKKRLAQAEENLRTAREKADEAIRLTKGRLKANLTAAQEALRRYHQFHQPSVVPPLSLPSTSSKPNGSIFPAPHRRRPQRPEKTKTQSVPPRLTTWNLLLVGTSPRNVQAQARVRSQKDVRGWHTKRVCTNQKIPPELAEGLAEKLWSFLNYPAFERGLLYHRLLRGPFVDWWIIRSGDWRIFAHLDDKRHQVRLVYRNRRESYRRADERRTKR